MDIAVVVQRQVASTRAGLMFTIDPSTGRADRVVIEGSFGLGESVVSGSVSPDRCVVEKETMAIATREVRSKELAIEPVDGGGTSRRQLSVEQSMRPMLDDAEVRQLADLAVQIERHYRAPQPSGHSMPRVTCGCSSGHLGGHRRSPNRAGACDRRGARRLRCFTASARHPAAPVGRCGSSRHSRTLAVLATETCW